MITRSQLRPRRSRRIQGLTPEYSQNRYNVGRRRLVQQGGVANVDNIPFNFSLMLGNHSIKTQFRLLQFTVANPVLIRVYNNLGILEHMPL